MGNAVCETEPEVAIVLLNYNGWDVTLDCLESLENMDYNRFDIVVVDNASTNRPFEIITKIKQKVDWFIQAPQNGGFAYGNNLGIQWAIENGFRFILLLNNDTIVDPGFLKKMIRSMMGRPNLGILGSRILYYLQPELVWFNGAKVNWLKGLGTHFDVGKKALEVSYRPGNDYITGCVMLVRAEVFEKIGLLDEKFFMYFEDVAFSQAVIHAGFKIDYVPDAIVYHKVGASGGGGSENWATVYYGNRSRRIFLNSKLYDNRKLQRLFAKSYFYSTRLVKLLQYAFRGDWKLCKELLRALTSCVTIVDVGTKEKYP